MSLSTSNRECSWLGGLGPGPGSGCAGESLSNFDVNAASVAEGLLCDLDKP